MIEYFVGGVISILIGLEISWAGHKQWVNDNKLPSLSFVGGALSGYGLAIILSTTKYAGLQMGATWFHPVFVVFMFVFGMLGFWWTISYLG